MGLGLMGKERVMVRDEKKKATTTKQQAVLADGKRGEEMHWVALFFGVFDSIHILFFFSHGNGKCMYCTDVYSVWGGTQGGTFCFPGNAARKRENETKELKK